MIKMILAVDLNWGIGYKGSLPWGNGYPEDLQYFKTVTDGQPVVMGSNTYLSLKRPEGLPNRKNIVITGKHLEVGEGVVTMTFREFEEYRKRTDEVLWIIGGKALYEYYAPHAKEIHLTKIDASFLADTYVQRDLPLNRPPENVRHLDYHSHGFEILVYEY